MKKFVFPLTVFLLFVLLFINACSDKRDNNSPNIIPNNSIDLISELTANPDFNWRTSNNIDFTINVPQGVPVGIIKIQSQPENILFYKGMANQNNVFHRTINIPSYVNQIKISYSDESLISASYNINQQTKYLEHTFEMNTFKSTKVIEDDDNDGVPNEDDDYPNDFNRAFDNSYPGYDAFNNKLYYTLAFEDTYFGTGDYDFNDFVADFRFEYVTNASDQIVDTVLFKFYVRCSGATHKNGFGFQLPNVQESWVTSVSGYDLTADTPYVNLDANNLEAGHNGDSATVIVFADSWRLFGQNKAISNTDPDKAYYGIDSFNIVMRFNSGIAANNLNLEDWNPFIIEQYPTHGRCLEIHLPDYYRTELGSCSEIGNNYRSPTQNLPWGIIVGSKFDYTIESGTNFPVIGDSLIVDSTYNILEMNLGHLHFIEWVQSDGVDYPDWYMAKTGYRDCQYFYINAKFGVCAHHSDPTLYPYLPNTNP